MLAPTRRTPYERAFTMVELIATMLVLAILSALAVVGYQEVTRRAGDAAAQSTLRNAAHAVLATATAQGLDVLTREDVRAFLAQSLNQAVADGFSAAGWELGRGADVPTGVNQVAVGFGGGSGLDAGGTTAAFVVASRSGALFGQTISVGASASLPVPVPAGTAPEDLLVSPPGPGEPELPVEPARATFRSTWDTRAPQCTANVDREIEVPILGQVEGTIDWGDGTVEALSVRPEHTYAAHGVYEVTVRGTFTDFGNRPDDTPECLLSVTEWTGTGTTNVEYGFGGAVNLVHTVQPPKSATSYGWLFYEARAFNGDIGGWDMSHVKDLSGMFHRASAFNQDIGAWDTSNARSLYRTFYEASSFNQDLSGWDTGRVHSMNETFSYAAKFNSPVNAWNTSKVVNMAGMFEYADLFNQPLDRWDLSRVESTSAMFNRAYAFNQPLASWDMGAVQNAAGMFREARAFNQPLASWDTSGLQNVADMFYRATKFNQPLASWDTSDFRDTSGMFDGASAFDQPLNGWNLGRVHLMARMFNDAKKFNQPLAGWNTSQVTDMSSMFRGASLFNQDLSRWNVAKVTSRSNFSGATFTAPKPIWK